VIQGALVMYTVYCRPSDFPENFVVRRWAVTAGKVMAEAGLWCLAETLEGARGSIPQQLYRQERQPGDDPVIVEVWF